jgi:hypothetical protein
MNKDFEYRNASVPQLRPTQNHSKYPPSLKGGNFQIHEKIKPFAFLLFEVKFSLIIQFNPHRSWADIVF